MFTTRSARSTTVALSCLLPSAAGCGAAVERPGFDADVTGAVQTTMRGSRDFAGGGAMRPAFQPGRRSTPALFSIRTEQSVLTLESRK